MSTNSVSAPCVRAPSNSLNEFQGSAVLATWTAAYPKYLYHNVSIAYGILSIIIDVSDMRQTDRVDVPFIESATDHDLHGRL